MEVTVFIRSAVVLVFFALGFLIVSADNEGVGELPFCGNKSFNQGQRELVIVSTLDGRLSALDVSNDGSLEWSVNTGPGPMLSSSIHRLELTNNGHWARMIPSLSGGLYRFNGDSIEAIPITADSLLHSSSFLFSDDLVIAGGKESRTYGVELKSGEILYECSMKGCDQNEKVSFNKDMLVVQRKTQTVRAVEVRTGGERWNFSVGQHELKLMSDFNTDCHDTNSRPVEALPSLKFKVIVPEGLVCAVSNHDSNSIVWKHKFDSPVVTAWYLRGDEMRSIDLFSGSQWTPQYNSDDVGPMYPSLYIGMHNKQLYIQESVDMQNSLAYNSITDSSPKCLHIPWVPVQATSLGLISADTDTKESSELSTTALSVLYASEYVNGNGYYLFCEKTKPQCGTNDTNSNSTLHETPQIETLEEETPVEIIIGSLWHWWKEVTIISLTTAALVNLIVNRNLIALRGRDSIRPEVIVIEKHIPIVQEPIARIDNNLRINGRSNSESGQALEDTSRYFTDFEQVHCLGKGGFGVVFEAKNKIDDRHYAIKRIALPIKQESRDRVLREVKALAKLEHTNIVRYFNAWLEFHPAGWEEEHDGDNLCSIDAVSISIPGHTPSIEKSSYFDDTTANTESSANINELANSNWKDLDFNYHKHTNLLDKFTSNTKDTGQGDSFIVFEDSDNESEPEIKEATKNVISTMDSTKSGLQLKSVSSWESNKTEATHLLPKKKFGHRRPGSLDFSQSKKLSSLELPSPTRVYLFIQMQLCKKESLREWLVDNIEQRSTVRVLQIFDQIVQAVHYIHFQGLIHRDLKPSNIFFSPDGQIKVGDFGLVTAMVEGGDEQRTPSRAVVGFQSERHTAQVGTQLYMSPEQLMGKHYNYKVDIYSLGLILFELLVPFSTQMERGQILTNLRKNIFPTDFQNMYPREFELLQLMLSHKPEERPTTVGIREKPPLCPEDSKPKEEQWHFELPNRRNSSNTSLSNSSSVDSSSWEKMDPS